MEIRELPSLIDVVTLFYSQSLFTLDLLEEFLSKRKVPRPDMNENWCKNQSYFSKCKVTSTSLGLFSEPWRDFCDFYEL